MKQIDKAALVAEIERFIFVCDSVLLDKDSLDSAKATYKARKIAYLNILSFLNTLEVKEVDLEKEYKDFVEEDPVYNKLVNGIVGKAIAKHFFELGLQAKTDKELVEEIYSNIDSIKDIADRMTSGNFMHERAAIKFSANTIAKVLELMGLKAQKGEEV